MNHMCLQLERLRAFKICPALPTLGVTTVSSGLSRESCRIHLSSSLGMTLAGNLLEGLFRLQVLCCVRSGMCRFKVPDLLDLLSYRWQPHAFKKNEVRVRVSCTYLQSGCFCKQSCTCFKNVLMSCEFGSTGN